MIDLRDWLQIQPVDKGLSLAGECSPALYHQTKSTESRESPRGGFYALRSSDFDYGCDDNDLLGQRRSQSTGVASPCTVAQRRLADAKKFELVPDEDMEENSLTSFRPAPYLRVKHLLTPKLQLQKKCQH
jgi:hypothetical protein